MKTTAILPIFNEEKTVAQVLAVLIASPWLDEIIVIDDASEDNSLKIVKQFSSEKLKVIHLDKNLGKSGAVKYAVDQTKTDVLFFCDGDLHGFKQEHINQLLKRLEAKEEVMAVGIMDRGFFHNTLVKKFGPLITGERAISYKVFQEILRNNFLNELMQGYKMEIVMNEYCVKNKIYIQKEILKGVEQTMKPYKNKNGFWLLAKETMELADAFFRIKFHRFGK
ncbi:MAG: glycosyltransferase family 2 protein [Candidatus Buchananbacteria bacterium]